MREGGREGEVRMLSFCVSRWRAFLSSGMLPVNEGKEGGNEGDVRMLSSCVVFRRAACKWKEDGREGGKEGRREGGRER
jgi:hypothetical protein